MFDSIPKYTIVENRSPPQGGDPLFFVVFFFGASQCSTGAFGQIWPIPYLSALKTIAFDYPVTNAILAKTFGYDAGSMARALCLSVAFTGFLMRRPLLDYGFGWKQLQSRSLLFSDHSDSTPFPRTNLLVRRPFCEH